MLEYVAIKPVSFTTRFSACRHIKSAVFVAGISISQCASRRVLAFCLASVAHGDCNWTTRHGKTIGMTFAGFSVAFHLLGWRRNAGSKPVLGLGTISGNVRQYHPSNKKWRMPLNEHDLNEQIQKRAYELCEHAGRPSGQHDEMWHRARAEIEAGSLSETITQAGTANADPEPTELPARM